jgi:5'-AMP-activated protein kinase regulatory beta subunit
MAAKKAVRAVAGGKKKVTFELRCAPGSSVFLAASFNAWDPAAKPLVDTAGVGVFAATCMLTPGSYEYKFVVNGEWTVDPANPNFVVNALGTLNSVVQVS